MTGKIITTPEGFRMWHDPDRYENRRDLYAAIVRRHRELMPDEVATDAELQKAVKAYNDNGGRAEYTEEGRLYVYGLSVWAWDVAAMAMKES